MVPGLNSIAKQPPLIKLLCWLLATALVAAMLQLVIVLLGLPLSLLKKDEGAGLLVAIALTFLLVLMSAEQRSLAEFGLVTPKNWRRQALMGLLIGVGFYATYCVVAGGFGAVVWRPHLVTPSRVAKALLAGIASGPIAVTQQIIFGGYLLSMLRDKHSRFTSIVVPALIFGLATGASRSGGLLGEQGLRLAGSMFLLACLLGMLRLRTGSIVVPAGLLAGCILVRKLTTKSYLMDYGWESANLWWLAPGGDPRQGIAMYACLGIAVSVAAWSLWRYGEAQVEEDAEVSASFKRIMPFSNLLAFTPIERWAVLLWQARLRVPPVYWPRLVVTLIASTLNSIAILPERLLMPVIAKLFLPRRHAPAPVFIVGMHRSGTTHLHHLLSLDPQFRAPRNYEVFNPHGFLTGWLTTALLTPVLTWRRPMDAVQMTVFSSQEEEFALAAMGSPSPYWTFCFPRQIARHDRLFFSEEFTRAESKRWRRDYRWFLTKLTLWSRRTPLLKNPANTGRTAELKQMFPAAKFVHIVRNPYTVYRSNQHFAEHGTVVFQLQNSDPVDNYAARCLQNYRRMTDAYYDASQSLPSGDAVDVRFEDIERDPMTAIKQIYRQLELPLTFAVKQKMEAYLESKSGYRKNQFRPLPAEDQEAVRAAMGPYLEAWGYEQPATTAKAA